MSKFVLLLCSLVQFIPCSRYLSLTCVAWLRCRVARLLKSSPLPLDVYKAQVCAACTRYSAHTPVLASICAIDDE
jgi:hypothetical protein